MLNLNEKLNNDIKWASRKIYVLSWIFIVLILILIVLRYANSGDKEIFWVNLDYWLLFFVLLDLIILNRVTNVGSRLRGVVKRSSTTPLSSNNKEIYSSSEERSDESRSVGLQNEKLTFGLICAVFILNLLWMVEKIMSKTVPVLDESVFLPNRLNYVILILGLVLLSLNKGPLGFWLKSWFLKFLDPRAFIVLALIFLIITPFLLMFQQEPVAEKTANMAYFMLVIGVLGQFVQYIRESRKESKKEDKLP